MLALCFNGQFVKRVAEAGWVDLPNGDRVSPATDGWSFNEYSLASIQDAAPIPNGKKAVSSTVVMVDGVPTYINTLVDLTAVELRSYASARKRSAETGGITISGMTIATDRESQGMIASAYTLMQRDPARVIQWKTETGFVSVDATVMTVIADAVADHVQACFAKEAEISGLIDSGEIVSFEEIDAANWPA